MLIFLKILLLIILVIILLVLIIIFIPFNYHLCFSYDDNECFALKFKYLFFYVNGFLRYKPLFNYQFKLWNKILFEFNSKEKKEKNKKNNNSISDTGFINDKSIESEIIDSKDTINDLFLSAKKLKHKQNISKNDDDNNNFDKIFKRKSDSDYNLKYIIPYDKIYVVKKILSLVRYLLDKLNPKHLKIEFIYNNKDPYNKGLLYAVSAPIYAILGDDLKIKTSEIGKESKCEINMSGSIFIFILIKPIYNFFTDSIVRKELFK